METLVIECCQRNHKTILTYSHASTPLTYVYQHKIIAPRKAIHCWYIYILLTCKGNLSSIRPSGRQSVALWKYWLPWYFTPDEYWIEIINVVREIRLFAVILIISVSIRQVFILRHSGGEESIQYAHPFALLKQSRQGLDYICLLTFESLLQKHLLKFCYHN